MIVGNMISSMFNLTFTFTECWKTKTKMETGPQNTWGDVIVLASKPEWENVNQKMLRISFNVAKTWKLVDIKDNSNEKISTRKC